MSRTPQTQSTITISQLVTRRSASFSLNVSKLTLRAGTLLCVAGPNGSGKSTLIENITGLLPATQGVITIQGVPVSNNLRAIKAMFGYIPDDDSWFIEELSAHEYFQLLASIYKDAGVSSDINKEIIHLAGELSFTAYNTPLSQLSHGNKKKVQIIAALMHRPSLIIVDELRNGLDPLVIIKAEQLLSSARSRGACIIAATHDIWWADRVADEILLLINGAPVLHQTPATVRKTYGDIEQAFLTLTRSTNNRHDS